MKKISLIFFYLMIGALLGAAGTYVLRVKEPAQVDPRFDGMLRHADVVITDDNFHCENIEGRRVSDVIASMIEMSVGGHGRLYSRCGEDEGAEFCDFVYSSCASAAPFTECWGRTLRGIKKGSSFDTGRFSCVDVP